MTCAFRNSQGQVWVSRLSASAIRNGIASDYRSTATDITDKAETHVKVQHLPLHDTPTSLPNRNRLS